MNWKQDAELQLECKEVKYKEMYVTVILNRKAKLVETNYESCWLVWTFGGMFKK